MRLRDAPNPRDAGAIRIGLQLSLYPQEPGIVNVMVYRSGQPPMRWVFGKLSAAEAPVPFEVAMSAAGRLTVTYHGSSYSVGAPEVRPRRVVIGCSTGEFEFTDVRVSSRG